MFVILGIGNPGKKYDGTRHNIGFIAMDYMSAKYNININKIKHKALIGEGTISGEKVILVKPQTYVNLSGESLREICSYYKVPVEKVIVIHDDISLSCGRMRIREKGSDGGHNGIKSIIYHLSSDSFTRIKIGVGEPPANYDLADWVLGRFSKEEVSHLSKLVDCIVEEVVPKIITDGAKSAMNDYNGKAF
ncbi:MAG: aminoacyl-tRNA hydrolase [Clostridia bacterium]|nr:aminoacyl-tRNA hydrolase [Clostridia bacterium]